MADSQHTPQDPFATPMTTNDLQQESENPDDWEYEYSTTETEVEALNLFLSWQKS